MNILAVSSQRSSFEARSRIILEYVIGALHLALIITLSWHYAIQAIIDPGNTANFHYRLLFIGAWLRKKLVKLGCRCILCIELGTLFYWSHMATPQLPWSLPLKF